MGEKIKENWQLTLMNAAISLIIAFVIFSVTNKHADAKENSKKLEQKLDKIEFVEFKKENKKELDKKVDLSLFIRLESDIKTIKTDIKELLKNQK